MQTRTSSIGGVPTREIVHVPSKRDVLLALLRAGYTCRGHVMASPHTRVTRHAYKVSAYKGTDAMHACVVRRGVPVLLALTRVAYAPWCILVFKHVSEHHDTPRMFLLRCVFSDDELFDGTICEGYVDAASATIALTDVSCFKGAVLQDHRRRMECVRHVVAARLRDDAAPLDLRAAEWVPCRGRSEALSVVRDARADVNNHHVLVSMGTLKWLLLL